MRKKLFIFLVLILFESWNLYSQISHGGTPLSFNQPSLKSLAVFYTPSFDYEKMLQEDRQVGRAKPFRYGKNHEVNLNPENSGSWNNLADGNKVWQLRINSSGAYSIGLIFNIYRLEGSARVFIYSSDRKNIIGSFTKENNKKNGWFSTAPVSGDDIIIELNVPEGQDYGQLNLSGIVHDYKNVLGLKTGFNSSGDCNVNINCPEGADWQIEKRAVVKYNYTSGSSSYLCTGSLINNTAKDGKPYLLTAEHCINTLSEASSANFWFNYESPDCSNTNSTYQSISSADLIATGNNLDFSLLELSSIPPYEYNAYYAGWNRKATPAANTVSIHHPQGDIKKISVDNDPPIINDYGSGYVTNSHWNIVEWDLGTTEGGSSGSPLFDQNHLIVGDLTGGDAYCGYSVNDYYARFDMSWDYYPEATKQLKIWLDPLNSGVETLSGYEPVVTDGLDAALSRIIDPIGVYCDGELLEPIVVISNKGLNTITSLTISYQIEGGTIVPFNWVGSLTSLETDTIRFDPVGTVFGESTFKAFVSEPNGLTDANLSNDTLVTTFVVDNVTDAKISQIIHPIGAYCAIDSVAPQVKIMNDGSVGLKNLIVGYQIADGAIITELWSGNLQTGESEIVTFRKIILPFGKYSFKAFVSGVICALDLDPSNDTLEVSFDGQNLIEQVSIEGPSEICYDAYEKTYNTQIEGQYLWNATGGKVQGANTMQFADVLWDDWGVRTLHLNVTNTCNSKDAEPLEIHMVEHNLKLEIELGENGASACWSIEDCEGNTLMEDCELPSNGTYTTSICIPKGCYRINIQSAQSGVSNYFLIDKYNNQIITQGNQVTGIEATDFILNASPGLASINLYPNPASTELVIEANFIEIYDNASFAIYNLRGEQLTPFNMLDERKVLDITKLPKGLYILKVISVYGNFSKKFVKP